MQLNRLAGATDHRDARRHALATSPDAGMDQEDKSLPRIEKIKIILRGAVSKWVGRHPGHLHL
jgi:hypothetical protein